MTIGVPVGSLPSITKDLLEAILLLCGHKKQPQNSSSSHVSIVGNLNCWVWGLLVFALYVWISLQN